jgi:DNA polymerase-3 subunit epsilon
MDFGEALAIIEASDDYRVLRRIKVAPGLLDAVARPDTVLHRGLFIDTETTGLDHKADDVIELAAVPFEYDDAGTIYSVAIPFHSYAQPRKPIPPAMTKINGITDEMVAGKSIDRDALAEFAHGADLVIAHHAEFDRPFCEDIWSGFEAMPWACSMEQVPWDEEGVEGRKLSYIASSLGYFYHAHNAINDCMAALFLLSLTLPSGRTGLSRLLDKALLDSRRVWAIGSPFETKDILKARGYRWNGGEDGRYKAWHIEIATDALEAELTYLRDEIYRCGDRPTGGRIATVTPRDRFTVRG